MSFGNKIFRCFGLFFGKKSIHNNKLYLHFVGDKAFYVYRSLLPRNKMRTRFRKTRKVRRQFNKNPVILHRTDDSGNSFSCCKIFCVFLPCSKQFLVGKAYSSVLVPAGNNNENVFSVSESVARVADSGNADAVDGQKGRYPAADVNKTPEIFHVRHHRGYNISGNKSVQVVQKAFFLHLSSGANRNFVSAPVRIKSGYAKANGFVDP